MESHGVNSSTNKNGGSALWKGLCVILAIALVASLLFAFAKPEKKKNNEQLAQGIEFADKCTDIDIDRISKSLGIDGFKLNKDGVNVQENSTSKNYTCTFNKEGEDAGNSFLSTNVQINKSTAEAESYRSQIEQIKTLGDQYKVIEGVGIGIYYDKSNENINITLLEEDKRIIVVYRNENLELNEDTIKTVMSELSENL